MTSAKDERERFEEWARQRWGVERFVKDAIMALCWEAWQASAARVDYETAHRLCDGRHYVRSWGASKQSISVRAIVNAALHREGR